MQNSRLVRLKAFGHQLPKHQLNNHDLAQTLDTSDEWITTRTGIKSRRIASDEENSATLALQAVNNLIDRYPELTHQSPEIVITATSTPDSYLPSISSYVLSNTPFANDSCMAFDLNAACSGFVYALDLARTLMISKNLERALIIGSDTMSRAVDWKDRNISVLFGDGAGCVWLERDPDFGIIDSRSSGQASGFDHLNTNGSYQTPDRHHLTMEGKEVFKYAVRQFTENATTILFDNHFTTNDLDWFITHQANARIIHAVGKQLGIDSSKTVLTVDRHANTSSASLPLALSECAEKNQFKEGDLILLEGFGAGYTWGSILMRF